jgi:hypothetical protein
MKVMPAGYRPSALLEDSWVVCPFRGCQENERDGGCWENHARNSWCCRAGHEFTFRTALIEVEAR